MIAAHPTIYNNMQFIFDFVEAETTYEYKFLMVDDVYG